VLVVSGVRGADGDVPDHAVIVRQAHLAAHGVPARPPGISRPGFPPAHNVHAVYASRPLGRAAVRRPFSLVPAPPLQARAILVQLPPN
jgi:hypothetical protein